MTVPSGTGTCVHCSRTLPTHQLRPKRLFGRRDGNRECRDIRDCFRAGREQAGQAAPR